MMTFGFPEILLVIAVVLMWVVPFLVIVILVRNYLRNRRTKESRELQAEIELLREQVAALEARNSKT